MSSPYHQGGGSHGPAALGGSSSTGGGPGVASANANVPTGYSNQMHHGSGMSLETHTGISNEQPDHEGNPQQDTQQHQQTLDFNIPVMCRIGQETVQEIVAKAAELFQLLRSVQPPTGTMNPQAQSIQEERKAKVGETLSLIQSLFKRLRRVFEICADENCVGGEFTSALEPPDVSNMIQQLVPLEDDRGGAAGRPKDHGFDDDKKPSESMRALLDERQRLQEQVFLKNRQLKEIIDMVRNVVCEINTMLVMRKKHLPFTNRMTAYKTKPAMF